MFKLFCTTGERDTPRHTHHLADTVEDEIDELSTDGVVASGVVIGRVLLPRDQLFRVEQLAIGTSPNLVCNTTSTYHDM